MYVRSIRCLSVDADLFVIAIDDSEFFRIYKSSQDRLGGRSKIPRRGAKSGNLDRRYRRRRDQQIPTENAAADIEMEPIGAISMSAARAPRWPAFTPHCSLLSSLILRFTTNSSHRGGKIAGIFLSGCRLSILYLHNRQYFV